MDQRKFRTNSPFKQERVRYQLYENMAQFILKYLSNFQSNLLEYSVWRAVGHQTHNLLQCLVYLQHWEMGTQRTMVEKGTFYSTLVLGKYSRGKEGKTSNSMMLTPMCYQELAISLAAISSRQFDQTRHCHQDWISSEVFSYQISCHTFWVISRPLTYA